MASFIIHHTAGMEFLKSLQESSNISLTQDDINDFLLGNLIVDSVRSKDWQEVQEEKIATHFRSRDKLEYATQYPDLGAFLEKYKELVTSDYSALGYFFHLFTDYMFFTYLFDKTFEYYDESGNVVELQDYVKSVHVKKTDKCVSLEEFYGSDDRGIYHDYTVMNRIVLDEFGLEVDIDAMLEWAKNNFHNPGIEEVDYAGIESVLNKLRGYLKSTDEVQDKSLNVFRPEDVTEFIRSVTKVFISEYYKKSEKGLVLKMK